MTLGPQLTAFGLLLAVHQVFGAYLYGEKIPEGAFWSYRGDKGPEYWCKRSPIYSNCCGKTRQSPVNINIDATKYPASHLTYKNYDVMPSRTTLFNNGHTVVLKSNASSTPSISFNIHSKQEVYEIDEVHFHWGKVSSRGSEHTLNKVASPMEMHFVHKLPKFEDLFDATQASDSIAVIGVFFEISKHDNPRLNTLVESLKLVKKAEDRTVIQPLKLTELLPKSNDYFFSYNGSLTTPPCSENVAWFLLHTKVPISETQRGLNNDVPVYKWHLHEFQLNKFRQLLEKPLSGNSNDAHPIVDNFRPQQNLNGRLIYRSKPH